MSRTERVLLQRMPFAKKTLMFLNYYCLRNFCVDSVRCHMKKNLQNHVYSTYKECIPNFIHSFTLKTIQTYLFEIYVTILPITIIPLPTFADEGTHGVFTNLWTRVKSLIFTLVKFYNKAKTTVSWFGFKDTILFVIFVYYSVQAICEIL